MPRGQDDLIAAVAAVNPRTIVVRNTGDPVTMPWVGKLPAILELWYPGQRVGEATAALLLGDAGPSGKLPVTFPVRNEDSPTFSADGSRYPGVDNEEFYAEGIFAGAAPPRSPRSTSGHRATRRRRSPCARWSASPASTWRRARPSA